MSLEKTIVAKDHHSINFGKINYISQKQRHSPILIFPSVGSAGPQRWHYWSNLIMAESEKLSNFSVVIIGKENNHFYNQSTRAVFVCWFLCWMDFFVRSNRLSFCDIFGPKIFPLTCCSGASECVEISDVNAPPSSSPRMREISNQVSWNTSDKSGRKTSVFPCSKRCFKFPWENRQRAARERKTSFLNKKNVFVLCSLSEHSAIVMIVPMDGGEHTQKLDPSWFARLFFCSRCLPTIWILAAHHRPICR